ncbi:L-2-hydroxyglutarate oxidase LhgO [Tamilnaduibacter salinus]|uniref:L-2-hydroxyglutarate oxidase LhgO n=1 Tax=Tamilnaduibacter salinus TaxID=1484056 RepID=A0A2U1CUG0_9GAMM|nr:NAD(P)/FAD-dependent oxidoreductase [Tamilnaduibacter salinus]PVY70715.1 L-2-hydroxyglutarate oxidase LhgO [Tamilnaduibacter salinus]
METFDTDTVIIGAGVVGLAVGRALALSGQQVFVLERRDHFGEETSSRNSEVIHAGIYYPDDSLKARLCIEGKQRLYEYCRERGVPHRNTGKWIIAAHQGHEAALSDILTRAGRLEVPLERAGQEQVRRALPAVTASSGLYSPTTGIIDSHALMQSLLADMEGAGGQLVCRSPVERIERQVGTHELLLGGDVPCRLRATRVVNAAGLWAIDLMRRWQGYPSDHIPVPHFARGSYFSYPGQHPFSTLVYPVPEPGGLGVHLTLDLGGQARFGPDVEWVQTPDCRFSENRRDRFADAIRQWWPGLEPARLQPAYAGVRPKLGGPEDGFQDFRIEGPQQHGVDGVVQLLGIESPGLTASLSIAERVRELLA